MTLKTAMWVLQLIKRANLEVFHTAWPFFYSVYFIIQGPSRISLGKVEDKGLKEL